jgi:Holliday junction resolvase RusA-like endonuclease
MLSGFIQITGKIQPKERPRFNRKTGRVYTPSATGSSENAIGYLFKKSNPYCVPTGKPVILKVNLYIPVTKELRKLPHQRIDYYYRPISKPDVDNILKTIMDGLNGVLYLDDSQVCDVRIVKHYSFEKDFVTRIEWQIETQAISEKKRKPEKNLRLI